MDDLNTTGAQPAINGGGGDITADLPEPPPAVNGEPPVGWVRAADVAREVGRDPRRVREYLASHSSAAHTMRVSRAVGGAAEVWLSPIAAAAARARFAPPAINGAPPAPADARPIFTTGAPPAPADAEGWVEALAEARANARRAEALADSLRAQLDTERVERQAATRRADEAERGQAAALARVADLRAAWWRWRLSLETLGLVARLRGRWPADPPEIEQPPLLAAPKE